MIRLFAALDGSGSMRFIGEVARGAACGCFCPECASPLVAKLGDEREWHFAHEAGQERPECEPGAMNMLRRLAVKHLRAQPSLELPPCSERVIARSVRGELSEEVSWNAQFAGALEWLPMGAKSAPVAIGRLDSGVDAELLVEIGEEASRHSPGAPGAAAAVAFWCSVPALPNLRKRSDAEQHIAKAGRFYWKRQPDVLGLVAAARDRLGAQVAAHNAEADRSRQRQAEEAGRRLAQAAQRSHAPQGGELAPGDADPVRSSVGVGEASFSWAPRRKPNTAFAFYRMTDGSAWVIYTMGDGSMAMAPWPRAEEGWDEALPGRVGVADPELGVYRIPDLATTMIYLSPRSTITRTSSNPRDFEDF